jgi:hypothetical protein
VVWTRARDERKGVSLPSSSVPRASAAAPSSVISPIISPLADW